MHTYNSRSVGGGRLPAELKNRRDDPVVKNTCSSRGPGFDSRHPRGSSQLSMTQVPRDPMSSSDLPGHQACIRYSDIHVSKTLIHVNQSIKT